MKKAVVFVAKAMLVALVAYVAFELVWDFWEPQMAIDAINNTKAVLSN